MADHAEEFLRFALAHFDSYWLSTHCRGNREGALRYLQPYANTALMKLLAQIKATNFNVLKTEALPIHGDFFWIEDRPMASELVWLEQKGLSDRLLRVDTYTNRDDLGLCLQMLESELETTPANNAKSQ